MTTTTISRPDLMTLAGMTRAQLENLERLGIVSADIGNERKKYSAFEGRLAVIAGQALKLGIPTSGLAEAMSWLRGWLSGPADIDLPASLANVMVQLRAQRYASLYSRENPAVQERLKLDIAALIYSSENADDFLAMSHDAIEKFFSSVQAERKAEVQDAVIAAIERARKLLEAGMTWSIEDIRKVDNLLDFELALRDKKNFFIQLASDEEHGWAISVGSDLTQLEKHETWVTIDVRRVFRTRRI